MGENRSIDAYERKFFELLLRHELPANCEIQIEVRTKDSKTPARAMFSVRDDSVAVKSDLGQLNLRRVIPPCW
jgi:hypothetical protein